MSPEFNPLLFRHDGVTGVLALLNFNRGQFVLVEISQNPCWEKRPRVVGGFDELVLIFTAAFVHGSIVTYSMTKKFLWLNVKN